MRNIDRVVAALEEHRGATHSWLVGEPCFAPPQELTVALAETAQSASFRYPPREGLAELRQALATLHRTNDAPVTPDQIAVTTGAKGGLLALLATLLEPGDELIHPLPCYPAYPMMASRLGARPVGVRESGRRFSGWVESIVSRIGPRTRAVVLSSPSNPTGTTLSSDTAESLVDLCRRHGLRLISDEAYVDFRLEGTQEGLPAFHDPDRTTVVQVRSASKSWALCGWRVGWILADPTLITRVARTHASLVNPAPGPAQTALSALGEISAAYLDAARAAVDSRMNALSSALTEMGISHEKPEGGFYLWLDMTGRKETAGAADGVEWCVDLARRFGVGLWPGEDFGGPGHVRIAATAPSDANWETAVPALVEALASRL
jgi:aspartate/methionine/tyrosine aminotransferase